MQNLLYLKKNIYSGQAFCINTLYCKKIKSVWTKITKILHVYLYIKLTLSLHYLSKYSVTEKTYAQELDENSNTEFYTDDILRSLNSVL